MHASLKKLIDLEIKKLEAMHSIRETQEHEPCRDIELDELEFKRIFGAGDEQQHRPRRLDQVQFDHGHNERDFA